MRFDQLGPYRIGRQIGRGGMGTVYQGTNVETGQPAAVKVLNPRLAIEEGFRERFQTEIETLKKLKHPNIVRLYGFGEHDLHFYYAMELVEGTNLEDELQAGRRFNWRETTQLGIKLAKALKHAHDHGVIHRDLKPANLLLTADDDIKLADFGIARLFGNTRLTSDGGLIGTAEYMAPEQADGRPVTFHCDLYSLGGVLFAMLAGRPPFRGGSLPELLQYHRYSEPPRVSRVVSDVPDELDQIITRLLSKDPQARATNALVVARQLSAMEHALSLPRTGLGESPDHNGPPNDTGPRALDDATDPGKLAAPPLPPAIAHNDKRAVATARTLSDPLLDPDATEPGEPIVESAWSGAAPAGLSHSLPDPTRTTSAAPSPGALVAPAESGQARSDHRAPREKTESISRFTTVEEDEQRTARQRQSERGPVWAQIALVASLAMVLGLGWYFMRPATADNLYQKIEAIAADEKPERLLDAEDDIHHFLTRFPDDPRGAKLKSYLDEIELLHLERRVQRLPRQLAAGKSVAPIQRDYVEATSLAGTAPQRAIAKLQAILFVYGQIPNPPEATTQFLELARRKLKQLQDQSQHEAPDYLAMIDASLAEADKLRTTDPTKARAIWTGIVELYGDKLWAADRVSRAKAALGETGRVITSGQ